MTGRNYADSTMRCSIAVVLMLALALPSNLVAQELKRAQLNKLPKPVWVEREGVAYMDHANVLLLAQLYAQYKFLFEVYYLDSKLFETQNTLLKNTMMTSASYQELAAARLKEIKRIKAQRDAELKKRVSAEIWSIKGKALPWAIVAGVVLFSAGMYTGTKLTGSSK